MEPYGETALSSAEVIVITKCQMSVYIACYSRVFKATPQPTKRTSAEERGETAHLSLVAYCKANIIDNIQQGLHGTAQSSATCKENHAGVIGRLNYHTM